MADSTQPVIPAELPVLPLREAVAFPLSVLPLTVNRPVSIDAVNRALAAGDRMVFLALQSTKAEDPQPPDLHAIGTVGVIRQMARTPAGIQVVIEGIGRGQKHVVNRTGNTMTASIAPLPEIADRTPGSRRVRAAHPGAGGQGAVAHQRPGAGAARRRRQPRRPAAPGLPARQPARHAGRRQADAARGRPAAGEAGDGVGRPGPRDRAARSEGQDRVAGAAGDVRRAAAVLPAPAAQGHSGGAGRGRGRRDQAAAREGRRQPGCRKRCSRPPIASWAGWRA